MTHMDGYEGPLAEFAALRTEIENRVQRQQGFQTLKLRPSPPSSALPSPSQDILRFFSPFQQFHIFSVADLLPSTMA